LERIEERKRSPQTLSLHNQFCGRCIVVSDVEICAIVQRTLAGFSEIHEGSIVDPPYTEPAFVTYLKGQEAASLICNPCVIFPKSGSGQLKNIASSSDIVGHQVGTLDEASGSSKFPDMSRTAKDDTLNFHTLPNTDTDNDSYLHSSSQDYRFEKELVAASPIDGQQADHKGNILDGEEGTQSCRCTYSNYAS